MFVIWPGMSKKGLSVVHIESVALASVTVGQVRWGNDPLFYDAGLHPVILSCCDR